MALVIVIDTAITSKRTGMLCSPSDCSTRVCGPRDDGRVRATVCAGRAHPGIPVRRLLGQMAVICAASLAGLLLSAIDFGLRAASFCDPVCRTLASARWPRWDRFGRPPPLRFLPLFVGRSGAPAGGILTSSARRGDLPSPPSQRGAASRSSSAAVAFHAAAPARSSGVTGRCWARQSAVPPPPLTLAQLHILGAS